MKCKCKYFHVVNGERVCVQCGKSAEEIKAGRIEDKVVEQHEAKIYKPESKRLKKRKK